MKPLTPLLAWRWIFSFLLPALFWTESASAQGAAGEKDPPAAVTGAPATNRVAATNLAARTPASATRTQEVTQTLRRYAPASRGRPDLRVSAGSRAPNGEETPPIAALVPASEQVAFTTQAQPTLYCYTPKPVLTNVEFALIVRNTDIVVWETNLVGGLQHPITFLDFRQLGIELKPDIEYRWSVAIVPDPQQRSRDEYVTGVIRRITPDEARLRRIEAAAEFERPSIYEREGLWYDAVDALMDLWRLAPTDSELERRLSDLIFRAGLRDVKLR